MTIVSLQLFFIAMTRMAEVFVLVPYSYNARLDQVKPDPHP